MQLRPAFLVPALSVAWGFSFAVGGCGDDATNDDDGKGGKGNGGSTSTSMETPMVGAPGVVINQIAIYQGVKRTLMNAGAPANSNVPLIPGRDTFLRIFYTTDVNYNGAPVTARLHIDGQPTMELVLPLAAGTPSTDASIDSTVNFTIPGAAVVSGLTYQVQLLQAGPEASNNPYATYPVGSFEAVPANGGPTTLRIAMAPLQYNADGSGRVPDLSPPSLEAYRRRFMQWYPVSNVELTVRTPLPWVSYIGPFGDGWEDVMYAVANMRQYDGAAPSVYYYGLFNPASSFFQYCSQGCLLGLTFQGEGSAPWQPDLRFAAGVGYMEAGPETSAHEIGHAHGRLHVDCGPGVDGIDPGFPYNPNTVGSWGWDPFTGQLVNPQTHTDFMSYCENNWISDYNYIALNAVGAQVNVADIHPGPDGALPPEPGAETHAYEIVSIDGEGAGHWFDGPAQELALHGEPIDVTAFTETGHPRRVRGHYRRFDHLPGGWLFVEKSDFPTAKVELVVDGQFTAVAR